MTAGTRQTGVPAGLGRRLGALVYDSLLIGAIWFVAEALFLGLTGGEAVSPGSTLYPLNQLYLAAWAFAFYGGFWTHGGQTLGMRAWRIALVSANDGRVTWRQALTRFVTAPFAWLSVIGIVWLYFHSDRKAWQDLASRTTVIHLRPGDSL